MPDPTTPEDQAVRYLLGELEGVEKAAFEAHLAGSPALRTHLQELESATDALALATPARRPPPRVWQHIARETQRSVPASLSLPAPPSWVRIWREWFGRAGWVTAALVVLLLATRHPRQDPSRSTPSNALAHVTTEASNNSGTPLVPASPTQPNARPLLTQPGSSTQGPSFPTPVSPLETDERITLRHRLQELSTLNQALSQRLVLPPGSGRFQVFRLTPTNQNLGAAPRATAESLAFQSPGVTSPDELSSLQFLVSKALARELASANPVVPSPAGSSPTRTGSPFTAGTTANPAPTATSASASPTGDSGTTLAASTPRTDTPSRSLAPGSESSDPATSLAATDPSGFEVVELSSSTLLADNSAAPPTPMVNRSFTEDLASPDLDPQPDASSALAPVTASALGVYSSETGLGSIAFVDAGGPAAGFVYQFWAFDNQSPGVISLGTTSKPGDRILVRFSLDPGMITSPAFMITLEPEGGSSVPTGPVIVSPPGAPQPGPTPRP